MKRAFVSSAWCLLLLTLSCAPEGPSPGQSTYERISISGAWAMYPMVVTWAEHYHALHPSVSIDVSAGGAGKGMADALSNMVDLGMVSRDVTNMEREKGAWVISLVKDAVVPVMNADHPLGEKIAGRGMTREDFTRIWIFGEWGAWEEILRVPGNTTVRLYTRSDACGAAKTWASFLGGEQEDLQGVGVYGDPGLAEAVRGDVLGMGYNNINFAYDRDSGFPIPGLRIIPLDVDEDGVISKKESVYGSLAKITEAISLGVYPSPPARDLHFVSSGPPSRTIVKDFIRYCLTEGQLYVKESGYITLADEILLAELEKLDEQEKEAPVP